MVLLTVQLINEIFHALFGSPFCIGDYQTSRVQVNFGWKVRNLAKNKWFVLIAKSPSEKQQWIDAIRCQKERIESMWVTLYVNSVNHKLCKIVC